MTAVSGLDLGSADARLLAQLQLRLGPGDGERGRTPDPDRRWCARTTEGSVPRRRARTRRAPGRGPRCGPSRNGYACAQPTKTAPGCGEQPGHVPGETAPGRRLTPEGAP
ncbi:hypothetical protein ACFQ3Z_11600 [Streptomyces nogalater]